MCCRNELPQMEMMAAGGGGGGQGGGMSTEFFLVPSSPPPPRLVTASPPAGPPDLHHPLGAGLLRTDMWVLPLLVFSTITMLLIALFEVRFISVHPIDLTSLGGIDFALNGFRE